LAKTARITSSSIDRMAAVPGRYPLGDGLILQVRAPGKASFLLRYQRAGRRREMGLGVWPAVPFSAAREQAFAAQKILAQGKDPLDARAAERPSVTFDEVVADYLVAHAVGWKGKAQQAWRMTLQRYASPLFGSKLISEIGTDDVLRVLRPIWDAKTPTAVKLQRRIAAVLDYARSRKLYDGENVARWKGHLDHSLPAPGRVHRVEHQASVPYEALPAVMHRLEHSRGAAALAVRFAALTAARATAVTQARWSEINLKTEVWTIPPERMKDNPILRVPLSKAAIKVLTEGKQYNSATGLVFPGWVNGKPLSLTSLVKALRAAGGGAATTHGLRSSFRTWASEKEHSRELAEMSLGHVIGSKVERSYRHTDLLEPRRKLMAAWAEWLAQPSQAAKGRC
jgi:integrase